MTEGLKWWRLPLLATGVLFLFQAFPMPGPVRNAADFSWPAGFHLEWPMWHLIFTPFCSLADYLTVLSLKEQLVLQLWILVGLLIALGCRRVLWGWLPWLLFIAWGALIPRPMARLVAQDPHVLLIDFHSHSQFSHDGRQSFTPAANMLWHQHQGYNAAFITDHNRIEAASWAHEQSKRDWRETGYYSLMGEEISLQKTHLVLLGNHVPIDNRPYDSDFNRVPLFLHDMHAQRWLVLASLPEYWFYHWGNDVEKLITSGIDGFEIINSAPKALDFPLAKRRQIIERCLQLNLPMTGISDNHGYGYATAAWNAMTISGWRRLDPDQLELVVLLLLKKEGAGAVQVLERAKWWPQNTVELLASPVLNAWVYLRSLAPVQRLAWTVWFWVLGWIVGRCKAVKRNVIHG